MRILNVWRMCHIPRSKLGKSIQNREAGLIIIAIIVILTMSFNCKVGATITNLN